MGYVSMIDRVRRHCRHEKSLPDFPISAPFKAYLDGGFGISTGVLCLYSS